LAFLPAPQIAVIVIEEDVPRQRVQLVKFVGGRARRLLVGDRRSLWSFLEHVAPPFVSEKIIIW
jgi:hypothetical protein